MENDSGRMTVESTEWNLLDYPDPKLSDYHPLTEFTILPDRAVFDPN